MLPPSQHPTPEQNQNGTKGIPLNLWKQLEPYQQKLLAQKWGQLLRRMQVTRKAEETHDVDN
jgi:hypothetical protein